MKKLLKILLWVVLINVLARIAAQAVTKVLGERDDPDADTFKLVAIMDGRRFESVASPLRSGEVITVAGAADIDLRQAVLPPEGAHVRAIVVAGGVRILACKSWRIDLHEQVVGGQVQIEIPGQDELPDDAPTLHIDATVYGGGLVIAHAESDQHIVSS
jgi:predicted membrane protein